MHVLLIGNVHSGIESFSQVGSILRNSNPEDVTNATLVETFKEKLKNWATPIIYSLFFVTAYLEDIRFID